MTMHAAAGRDVLPDPLSTSAAPEDLLAQYRRVRRRTEDLAAPLSPEDMVIQSMTEASPTKWHLGHVTWFFEAVILVDHMTGYRPVDEDYFYLFNSYYEALGPRQPRFARGMLSRPPLEAVYDYRRRVDAAMERLIADSDAASRAAWGPLLLLGLNHEQQHQELILTDIKHALSRNPLDPVYHDRAWPTGPAASGAEEWLGFDGGLVEVGHAGPGFAYDNEAPRHKRWLEPFRIAARPVTNGDWLAFMAAGGYDDPACWLSDGWAAVQAEGWRAPGYWRQEADGGWTVFTLSGRRPVDPAEPVSHVSLFEADAFATWAGKRLPSEAEWEVAAVSRPGGVGALADDGVFHPRPIDGAGAGRMIGDVWEWTRSSYEPYPGFQPFSGAAREYNGKFMCGQMVLRGGSCATPADHLRPTYRNFFYPPDRWQFSGLRLAEDAR